MGEPSWRRSPGEREEGDCLVFDVAIG